MAFMTFSFSDFDKYRAFGQISLRQELAEKGTFISVALFFVFLMTAMGSFWEAAFESTPGLPGTPAHYTWYVFITEWILLSCPFAYKTIQSDILGGDISYFLTRPASYIFTRFAETYGAVVARSLLLGSWGFLYTWFFVGSIGIPLWALPFIYLLVLCGGAFLVIYNLIIGLTAVWLQDVRPIFMVTQKILFVFGGLLFPITIYPAWFENICNFLPFIAFLYTPASVLLDFSWIGYVKALAGMLFWGGLLMLLLLWVNKKAIRALQVGGG